MNIFIVGEHPSNHSGFSQLTHNISTIIHNNFKGDPTVNVTTIGYSRGSKEEISHEYRLLPAATPAIVGGMQGLMLDEDARSGMHTLRAQLRNITEPCIVLTIGDPWTFWYMKTTKLIFPHMKWVSYLPVESDELVSHARFSFPGRIIDADITRLYSYADKIIAYTENGMKVIQKMVGKEKCNSWLYHGIDNKKLRDVKTRTFKRLENRFVVGTVCRNGFRKALDVMMIGFANFIQKAKKVKGKEPVLLLHVPRHDTVGWNIPSLSKKLGIENNVIISDEIVSSFVRARDRQGNLRPVVKKGASIEDLVSMYKSMDCYLNVSRAEGFGIPLIEAMTLDIPVAYIDFANMSEICKNRGLPIEVGGYEYKENYEVKYAIANPDSISNALMKVYKGEKLGKMIRNAKEFTDSLDWNHPKMRESWCDNIREIQKEATSPSSIRDQVIMTSTYDVPCGIATYTKNLLEQLRKIDKTKDYVVIDDTKGLDQYTDIILSSKRNTIIHLQYEPNLYKPENLIGFITRLKSLSEGRIKVVITMHKETEASIKNLDGVVDAFVLHSDLFDIRSKIKYSQVLRFPHPFYMTNTMNDEQRMKKRAELGFKEEQLVLGTMGFLLPYKMILEISKKVITMMKDRPYALYLPLSIHRNDREGYAKKVEAEIMEFAESNGVSDRVKIELGFHEQEELMQKIQCLDVGFMYVNNPEVCANSGSVRMLISCGVPTIIANNSKIHKDLYGMRSTFNVTAGRSAEEFIDSGLTFVNEHRDIAKNMRASCIQAALRNSFAAFAAAHKVQIYDRLLAPIMGPVETPQPKGGSDVESTGTLQGEGNNGGAAARTDGTAGETGGRRSLA